MLGRASPHNSHPSVYRTTIRREIYFLSPLILPDLQSRYRAVLILSSNIFILEQQKFLSRSTMKQLISHSEVHRRSKFTHIQAPEQLLWRFYEGIFRIYCESLSSMLERTRRIIPEDDDNNVPSTTSSCLLLFASDEMASDKIYCLRAHSINICHWLVLLRIGDPDAMNQGFQS